MPFPPTGGGCGLGYIHQAEQHRGGRPCHANVTCDGLQSPRHSRSVLALRASFSSTSPEGLVRRVTGLASDPGAIRSGVGLALARPYQEPRRRTASTIDPRWLTLANNWLVIAPADAARLKAYESIQGARGGQPSCEHWSTFRRATRRLSQLHHLRWLTQLADNLGQPENGRFRAGCFTCDASRCSRLF